jgi:hypothetical protein
MDKKCIWTLNVDGYAPELTELTFPLLRAYASKIGAEFREITERRWPDLPPVYEKLQLHELGREYDWNVYVDADCLVHPDFCDITNHLRKDTVAHNGKDMADNRWRYDEFFLRDGRHIGACNWFTAASNWCLDLWHPLEDLTYDQAVANIFPAVHEKNSQVVTAGHLIDDYVLSRNIARYGLKFTTVQEILAGLGRTHGYLWHVYTVSREQKLIEMRAALKAWKIA